MENVTDSELIAGIRRSDEKAFYTLFRRHWKSLYTYILAETGDSEKAFEQVEELFAALWDRRQHLPEMTSEASAYFLHQQESESGDWQLRNVRMELLSYIRKLPNPLLDLMIGKRYLSINDGEKDN